MHSMNLHHNPTPDARHPSSLRKIATIALWATLLGTFAGCHSTGANWNGASGFARWDENGKRISPGYYGSGRSTQPDISGLIAFIVDFAH